MAPSTRTLYIAALAAAVAGSALAADDRKQPAPAQPTPSIKRMNEEAGQYVPAPTPAPAPATRGQAPAPAQPSPSVRRMGPAGTGGGTVKPPGWDLMTPQEREKYQHDLGQTKSSEECRILNQRQHDAMTQRARERGVPPPGNAGRDLCAR